MSFPTGVTLKVGNKDYTTEPDIKLEHSTDSPGGYKEARLTGLCRATMIGEFDLGDKFVVYDSVYNKYPFVGIVDTVHKKGSSWDVTAVRATQYGLHRFSTVPQDLSHPSGVIAGKVYSSGTPMVTALRDALQLCEDVFDGGITDPGSQFVTNSNNLAGQSAEQIWNYICSLLNNTTLQWHIRGANGLQVVVIDYQDLAPRYTITFSSATAGDEQTDETFTLQAIVNRVTVEYGNDQVYVEPQNPNPISHVAIKKIHDHFVQGGNNLTRLQDAQGMAGNYMSRFNSFRSVNDSITIKCDEDTIRVVPPLVLVPNDNWPLYLVEAGHGILLKNRVSVDKWHPQLKFITGTSYNWTTGELVIQCGEILNLSSTINAQVDYNVNRLFFGPVSGAAPRWGNHPLADADLIPVFGPEMPGDTPPSNVPGIPTMVGVIGGPTQTPQTPYNRVIHPGLVADEGIEINYTFDISTVGWHGGTWSIPGELQAVKFSLWKATATNGLQAGSCTFDIYTRKAGQNPQFLQRVIIAGQAEAVITISPTRTLPDRSTQLVFKVIVASTLAEIINVTLHAKKHYPGLKV